jgi:hypothetical protein
MTGRQPERTPIELQAIYLTKVNAEWRPIRRCRLKVNVFRRLSCSIGSRGPLTGSSTLSPSLRVSLTADPSFAVIQMMVATLVLAAVAAVIVWWQSLARYCQSLRSRRPT